MFEKSKEFVDKVSNFFTGLLNLASYPDMQEQLTETFSSISEQMKHVEKSLNANQAETARLSQKMDDFQGELVKVKDGLQMELFGSLQRLHSKLKEQHYATVEDKQEAKRYYDQIHTLGKDGWSQKYYDEIIVMPESKDEWYKSLNT